MLFIFIVDCEYVYIYVHIWSSQVTQQKRICLEWKRYGFDLWVRRIPWRKAWQPPLVFLPGESHGEQPGGLKSHRVAKSWIWLKWLSTHRHTCIHTHTHTHTHTYLYILFFRFFSLISSVQFSRSVMYNSLWPHELQHTRAPCPSLTPRVHPNPCLLSQWCHPTISFSVIPFSSCSQSFPASGSFQLSPLCASGGQSVGVSASKSVPPITPRTDLL